MQEVQNPFESQVTEEQTKNYTCGATDLLGRSSSWRRAQNSQDSICKFENSASTWEIVW